MSAEIIPSRGVVLVFAEASKGVRIGAQLDGEGYCVEVRGFDDLDAGIDARVTAVVFGVAADRSDRGLRALRAVRETCSALMLPILAVVDRAEPSLVDGLHAAGAHSFLDAAADAHVLAARLNSMIHLAEWAKRVERGRKEVESRASALIDEQRIAEKLFTRMTARNVEAPEIIRRLVSPHSVFNGDVLLTAHTPLGGTRVLLGDFTGHGLAAALGGLPLFDAFHSMTAKGFSIRSVVEELNKKMRAILPTGLFCGAIVFEVDPSDRTLRVWNGGMHPVLVRGPSGALAARVRSEGLALGILPPSAFDGSEQILPIEVGSRVLAYTDGVVEARHGQQMFGAARLEEMFERTEFDAFIPELRQQLEAFLGGEAQSDDITLVDLLFDGFPRVANADADGGPVVPASKWALDLTLEAESLRNTDPVVPVLQMVMEVQALQGEREHLQLILRELVNNAVDHGLLGLDSGWKASPRGFARYYSEREHRLAALEDAHLRIALRHAPTEDGGRLTVRVEDSGPGFLSEDAQNASAKSGGHAGRGIALVEGLCEQVRYEGAGNKVEVVYRWFAA